MAPKPKYGPEIIKRVLQLKGEGKTWRQIVNVLASEGTNIAKESARSIFRRHKTPATPPTCDLVRGVMASDSAGPSLEEALDMARAAYQRTHALEASRRNQELVFSHGPVAIAVVGDQHIGSDGTDYDRLFEEAEIIASTPGMFAITLGDGVDTFVIGKLMRERFSTSMDIPTEWAILRGYLEVLAPVLKIAVGGNHEAWIPALTGIDYFKDVVATLDGKLLYAKDDCAVTVKVGEREFPGRVRHRWKGRSIYNPTHGIERAAKFDYPFRWGVGGHTHESGVTRQFNSGGKTAIAGLCGSYKRYDTYATALGCPRPNDSTAIVLVFDEASDTITGFNDLEAAAHYMQNVYKGGAS